MIQTMSDYRTIHVSHVKCGEVKLMHSERHKDWAIASSNARRCMFGYTEIGARSIYDKLTGRHTE